MEQRRKKWRANEKKRKEAEKRRAFYNEKVKATMKVVKHRKSKKDDLLSNTLDSSSSQSDEAFVSHS